MFDFLNLGTWERPSDKMAVYTEILPGRQWGIRVTLLGSSARVEAIDGPRCSWYKPPKQVAAYVNPPRLLERLRGRTFEDKLQEAVAQKRLYAANQDKGQRA